MKNSESNFEQNLSQKQSLSYSYDHLHIKQILLLSILPKRCLKVRLRRKYVCCSRKCCNTGNEILKGFCFPKIIYNGWGELDRKLKTILRNRKRCLHNLLWYLYAYKRLMHLTGGPTWLRSAIAEIKQ